ncbi:MAG: YdiY family protein [Alcanivoracaceae bacterium]
MKRSLIALACTTVASLPLAAVAVAEEAPDRSWKGELEVAWLVKRGNTESDTFIGKTNAEKDGVRWRHTGKLEATNEEKTTAGLSERTAERYFASYKLDRKLGDNAPGYLFNIISYDKDLFSGFHYQASYALGLGRRWLDNDRHTLDTEAGPGYRVVCLEPETSYTDCQNTDEGGILRLGLKYEWNINDGAQFREAITTEISDNITTTRAETSLTSRINGRLAMRITHLLKHTSEVTAPAKKTDNELTVSLVYKF